MLTAKAIILPMSTCAVDRDIRLEETYMPSKRRKVVSFCIRVLPHPMAISGILECAGQ